jgi:hypothetical protein
MGKDCGCQIDDDGDSSASSGDARSTTPPVELKTYHDSVVDSEDCAPCIRDTVTHEAKV